MTGGKWGLSALLTADNPWQLSYLCANSKTALAASHTAKALREVKSFKEVLQHLFLFYSLSPSAYS